jgi:hypothetical protein
MAYNKWWQVEDATNYFGSNEQGQDIIANMAQDTRDPLEILIEAEEAEEQATTI